MTSLARRPPGANLLFPPNRLAKTPRSVNVSVASIQQRLERTPTQGTALAVLPWVA
ncbi:hypothetical protein BC567DRAFT_234357 [Phyllosticta citribraziliensis]